MFGAAAVRAGLALHGMSGVLGMKYAMVIAGLVWAGSVCADFEWRQASANPDVWGLHDTKIEALVADGAPFHQALRVCVKAPEKTSHDPCHVDDDDVAHFFVPATPEGWEMWDLAKLAIARGRRVTVQGDSTVLRPNNAGRPRCGLVRLVVLDKKD